MQLESATDALHVELETARTASASESMETSARAESLEAELLAERAQVQRLTAALTAEEHKSAIAIAEVASLDQTALSASDDVTALLADKARLESDLQMARDELATERQHLAEADDELDALRERLDRVVEERGRLRGSVATLTERLAAADHELARLQDENTTQLDATAQDQARIGELEAGRERLLAQIDALERGASDGQAAVEELATVKRAANKAVLAKNERIAALETELATVAAVAFKRSCAACESRRTQAAALTDEIARLQGIVGQLRSEAGDRESKLARVQKTNASLRDDKDGLNMALEVR